MTQKLVGGRIEGLRHKARANLTKYAQALSEDRSVLTVIERYADGAMRDAAMLEVLELVEADGNPVSLCESYIASLAARAGESPQDSARLRAWVLVRDALIVWPA